MHDLVEHRLLALQAAARVVVYDVHDDAQARAVEAGDHLPEFEDTMRIVGTRRVAALGRRVVLRVIAPVKTVLVAYRFDRCLLLGAVRCETGQVAGRRVRAAILGNRRAVERRQHVHVSKAGARQAAQVPHALAERPREGLECAPHELGHSLVVHAEVTHVQLVDGDVLRCLYPANTGR